MNKSALSIVDEEGMSKVAAMNDFHITVISPSKRHLDEIFSTLRGISLAASANATSSGPSGGHRGHD